MKYGDIVCWRGFDGKGSPIHEPPIMYVGICGHPVGGGTHRIDILNVSGTDTWEMEHKDSNMWQVCEHRNDD